MEIINIFYQVGIFILFFSISIPFITTKYDNNLNYLDQLIFNTIVQINLILFLSFLNITLKSILTIYFIYLVFFGFFLIKKIQKIKSIFRKENYHYFFLLIICLFLCFDISYSLTLGWDAEKFWFFKALNFYNGGTIDNLPSLANPQYPFLGSLLWAAFWKISFFPEEYFGRLFFVILYCLSLFSLADTLKLSNTSKTIFFTILVLLSYNYDYFDGTQDILIFSLVSLAAKIIFEIIGNSKKNLYLSQIILLLLICNSLIWTKQEGSIYAFIIILTLIIFSKIYSNKKILLFGSVVFLFMVRIFIYKYYNLDVSLNSCCWTDLSASALIEKASIYRSVLILKFFFFSFLKNYFFMFGLIFFIIIIFSKELLKKYMFIYFFYLMNYGFIFAAYISTDADLIFMLKTGMYRLIFSASPFYILIVTKYINSKKLNF